MISYERRGQRPRLVAARLQINETGLEITVIPHTDELSLLEGSTATISLKPMDQAGHFQWLGMNLITSKPYLFRVYPGQSLHSLEPQVNGISDIAIEGDTILVLTPDKLVTIEDGETPKYQPLPGGGDLTRMVQIRQNRNLIGTCFTQISPTPENGNYVFYKPSGRADLMVTPVYIFPQAVTSLRNKIYIFGIDKDRKFKMLELEISETDGKMVKSTELMMTSPSNSIGVGHAFVHVHPESGKPMVSLLLWDDPFLRRFDALTGAELTHTALNMFTAGVGSNHEARQSVILNHNDRHSAFTIQSVGEQGTPQASLIIGHGNTWKTMNVQGRTNGLTANGRWLAWEVRNTSNGADQVLFLDLDGEMNEFSGSLVLGQSNPGTEMPSFLAINTR